MNPPKSRIAHSLICLSAFVAWYLSPFFVLLMPDANNLLTSAYAFPFISILLMLPCALICWSYYQKRFNLMPIGKIDWQALILPIFALIGLMFLNALFGVEEEWVKSVSHISGLVFFLYVIALIIAAPIGEEIIFRGFLLNAGMWYGARKMARYPRFLIFIFLCALAIYLVQYLYYSHDNGGYFLSR